MPFPSPRRCPRLPAPRALVLSALLLLAVAGSARSQSEAPSPRAEGVGQALVRQAGLEGRVLWLDGSANLQRLSSREGLIAVLDHCVRAHINTVVVDVKPLSGHVLYASAVAPKLREWKGYRVPAAYDLLQAAVEEGHRRGLKIHANINVFSEGHKLVRSGPIYDKPDQQCTIFDIERTVTTPRGERRTLAVGENRPPAIDQITVYDSGYRSPRVIQPDEGYALVLSDLVSSIGDASTAPREGIRIPSDGYLLVGSGEGSKWLQQSLRTGDALSWTAIERLIPIVDAPSETVAAFANPALPAVRDYELKIVEEIASNYEIDGIVFDRMRYPSIHGDFSDFSRQKFEEFLGQKLNRFPDDIYAFDPTPNHEIIWGPYFRQWLEWRARTIRTWLEDAVKIVRQKRPAAKVGAYVGSWYTTYYSVGVNWGSEEFAPSYDWMSPTYHTTGYAGLLDWITTGCYHPIATRTQAREAGLDETYTVQAAAELSTRAVSDQAFVYAGIYALDYKGSPEAFREALHAARDHSAGVMLFDLSQIEEYGWWGVLDEEFKQPRTAPHDVPDLLPSVRALGKALAGASRPAAIAAAPN
jgi:uncharacterized lipoprotein YddW (UPF0748 family)